MANSKNKVHYITEGAVIAALYIALTYLSRILGIADGAIQFRLSEVLTVLPAFTPAAIPGLTIGCFIANLGSPFGIIDILTGTIATFIGAIFTYMLRKVTFKGIPILAPLPPVVSNGIIVSAMITMLNDACQLVPQQFDIAVFGSIALTVVIGEAVICVVLGIPLMILLKKANLDKRLFISNR